MPRRPGRRACPTGSARTRAPSPSSAGLPAMVVSDNLRSGITKACFYEPAVNRTYAEMAAHYDTAIVPARPYGPRDKAKVEVGGAGGDALDHRQAAQPAVLLARRVERGHRRAGRAAQQPRVAPSRREPTRAVRGAGAPGAQAAAGRALRLRRMEGMQGRARLPRRGREALLLGAAPAAAREGVGAHHGAHGRSLPPRQARRRACALLLQPQAHDGARAHAVEPPALCRLDAGAPAGGRPARSAASTSALVEIILRERTHPEQGFRACVGILRLAKTYGRERLEAACGRALEIGARSYSSVNSILKNNLDRQRPATRRGRAGDSARQHPRPQLLPLRR